MGVDIVNSAERLLRPVDEPGRTDMRSLVDIVNSAERLLRRSARLRMSFLGQVDIVNSAERLLRLPILMAMTALCTHVDIVNSAERLLRRQRPQQQARQQGRSISSIQPKGF